MGTFKIEIVAVGNHGHDRKQKEGEHINLFEGGFTTPDALAKLLVQALKQNGVWFDFPDSKATITHWPGNESEVVDDLLNDKRIKGNF